jgi:hypothetical protein
MPTQRDAEMPNQRVAEQMAPALLALAITIAYLAVALTS